MDKYITMAKLKTRLTEAEQVAFDRLARAADAILQLPVLHPSEQVETERDLHSLQMRLLARPELRAMGWPE